MPAHHRNSSSTSIVSTMGGFNGGISGGMAAGSRPLSGSISDLTFGGPSPTSANFPPSAYAPNGPRPGHSSGSFASRAGSFDSNALGLEHHRTGSSVSSRGGYAPSVATGMGQGLEHQRTGSFSGRGHRRTGSSGSWVPASAFEGGAGLMPPPPRRSSHVRSHSCDHLSQPQPPRREKKEEDIIFTGFGGVGKPAPSPSPSPTTTSFPQSRPLPVPVPRHPSRSSSSFVPPQRPYSAMGYPPSFTHSEAHLRSQSTGGLSMMAGTDPNFYVGAQSTGSASWIGSQPTGTYSLPPCTIPEGSVESASPAKPSVVADATPAGRKKLTKSSPSRREGSRSPSKEGSPTKSGGFKIFGRKKGKGIVNGDGVFVAGIGANVTPEDKKKEKRSSSPLKKLGLSLRSLSPKKGQDSPTKQTEALIWSAK
ncbi:hypothetical protein V5O48_008940 [Marasmius crinis-equi]|uniref:Uncharacterized protein n=1 Tax=Marasmius crinis-equi TaxID=585013 RepID=A0ABR3FD51_9AGAR